MNRVLRYQDGLNDDMVVDIYNYNHDLDPLFSTVDARRARHPIVVNGVELHETIGVAKKQTQYELYVYRNGCYDHKHADKIFGDRVGEILHQLKLMGEGVLVENPEPDDDDHTPAAAATRTTRKKAKKIIDYVEKTHNTGARSSIYRRIGSRNGVPPDKMDASDIIVTSNGAFTVTWGRVNPANPEEYTPGTVTFDPRPHPEARNTMLLGIPRVEGATCPEWIDFVTDALSYNENTRRDDVDNIESEVRLMRGLAGYWMVRGNPFQAIAIMMGSSGSGKGTIMEVLCGIYGSYAAKSRKDLVIMSNSGRIQADMSSTVHKHLAYVDEFNAADIFDTGRMRYMTNRVMTVEEKYCQPYEALNNMKLLMVTNYDNKFDAPDRTMARRLIILKFFKPEAIVANPLLAQQMLEREGPGILNWCIEGLMDVLAQPNGILGLVPPHIKKQIEDQLLMQDRLAIFLNTYLPKYAPPAGATEEERKFQPAPVSLKDVYDDMMRYFKAMGEEPPAKTSKSFGAILRNHKYKLGISAGYTKVYGVVRRPFTGLDSSFSQGASNPENNGKMLTRDIFDYIRQWSTGTDEGRGVAIKDLKDALHNSRGYDQATVEQRLWRLEEIGELKISDAYVRIA